MPACEARAASFQFRVFPGDQRALLLLHSLPPGPWSPFWTSAVLTGAGRRVLAITRSPSVKVGGRHLSTEWVRRPCARALSRTPSCFCTFLSPPHLFIISPKTWNRHLLCARAAGDAGPGSFVHEAVSTPRRLRVHAAFRFTDRCVLLRGRAQLFKPFAGPPPPYPALFFSRNLGPRGPRMSSGLFIARGAWIKFLRLPGWSSRLSS